MKKRKRGKEIKNKNRNHPFNVSKQVYFLLPVLRFMSTGAGCLAVRCETLFDCFLEGEGPREEWTLFLLQKLQKD